MWLEWENLSFLGWKLNFLIPAIYVLSHAPSHMELVEKCIFQTNRLIFGLRSKLTTVMIVHSCFTNVYAPSVATESRPLFTGVQWITWRNSPQSPCAQFSATCFFGAHRLLGGCFAPLKMACRDICHKFHARNPRRTMSRFDFCELFAKAGFRAFSMANIISSFEATGICPYNNLYLKMTRVFLYLSHPTWHTYLCIVQLVLLVIQESLHRRSIPIHSTPKGRDTYVPPSFSSPVSLDSPLAHSRSEPSFLDESIFAPHPLPCATTISKFLVEPDLPSHLPTKRGKSAGKVLTSLENMQQMQECETEKQATALIKEERKRIREKRKIDNSRTRAKHVSVTAIILFLYRCVLCSCI